MELLDTSNTEAAEQSNAMDTAIAVPHVIKFGFKISDSRTESGLQSATNAGKSCQIRLV